MSDWSINQHKCCGIWRLSGILFLILCECVYMNGYVHTSTGTSEATRSLKLKLGLQALIADPMRVLGIKLGPSARAEYILNQEPIFPAPRGIYITCTGFVHVTGDGTQGFVHAKHIPSHWAKAPTLNNLKRAASIVTLNIYTRKQKHLYTLNREKVHLHTLQDIKQLLKGNHSALCRSRMLSMRAKVAEWHLSALFM